jgi:YesN/AraC family two-component response regulator
MQHSNYKEMYLSGVPLASLSKQIREHLLLNRSYLKKGCTSPDLAAEMHLQPYLLSAVINQVYKMKFNDFLNSFRVDYARELIQNGKASLLTLEGLSEKCGFNNRNSFTSAFKKHIGKTPSDFIRKFQQTNTGSHHSERNKLIAESSCQQFQRMA